MIFYFFQRASFLVVMRTFMDKLHGIDKIVSYFNNTFNYASNFNVSIESYCKKWIWWISWLERSTYHFLLPIFFRFAKRALSEPHLLIFMKMIICIAVYTRSPKLPRVLWLYKLAEYHFQRINWIIIMVHQNMKMKIYLSIQNICLLCVVCLELRNLV